MKWLFPLAVTLLLVGCNNTDEPEATEEENIGATETTNEEVGLQISTMKDWASYSSHFKFTHKATNETSEEIIKEMTYDMDKKQLYIITTRTAETPVVSEQYADENGTYSRTQPNEWLQSDKDLLSTSPATKRADLIQYLIDTSVGTGYSKTDNGTEVATLTFKATDIPAIYDKITTSILPIMDVAFTSADVNVLLVTLQINDDTLTRYEIIATTSDGQSQSFTESFAHINELPKIDVPEGIE